MEFTKFPLKPEWSRFFSTGNLINFPLTNFPTEIDGNSQWTYSTSPLDFRFLHWSLHWKRSFFKKKNFENFSKSFFLQSYYTGVFFCQKNFTKDHSKIKFQIFTYFWDLKSLISILKILFSKFHPTFTIFTTLPNSRVLNVPINQIQI